MIDMKTRIAKTMKNAASLVRLGFREDAKKHFALSVSQAEKETEELDCVQDGIADKMDLGMLHYEYAVFLFQMDEYAAALNRFTIANELTKGSCKAWDNVKDAYIGPNLIDMQKSYEKNSAMARMFDGTQLPLFSDLKQYSIAISDDCYYLFSRHGRALQRIATAPASLQKPGMDTVVCGRKYYPEALKCSRGITTYIVSKEPSYVFACFCMEIEMQGTEEIVIVSSMENLKTMLNDRDVSIPGNVFASCDDEIEIQAMLHEMSRHRMAGE